jgi:septal ring factor EnvC (AmiA/AmiB activator)
MDAYHWLLYLTLLYLAVLVIALAAGLAAIARALIITQRNLAKIEAGLEQVAVQTKPLENSLQSINTALAQTSGGLLALLDLLNHSDGSLTRLANKLMVGK